MWIRELGLDTTAIDIPYVIIIRYSRKNGELAMGR
jgi:hypothetical protein